MVYDEIERARARLEAALAPAVGDLYGAHGDELVRFVRQGELDYAEAVAADRAYAREALGLVWGTAAPPFARATYEGLEPGDPSGPGRSTKQAASKQAAPEDVWLQSALAYLEAEGGAMVTAITETVLKDLRRVLTAGIEEGLGMDALARRLADEWPDVTAARALRIVRTEVIAASNWGAQKGAERTAEEFGLELEREWLATSDGRVRDEHADADGQRRGMAEPFSVGGYAADYPGDPALPASQRVNCRCALAFVPVEQKAAKGRRWRIERDEEIRAAYPALMERHGAEAAKTLLAEEHAVSERTVERAVYGR